MKKREKIVRSVVVLLVGLVCVLSYRYLVNASGTIVTDGKVTVSIPDYSSGNVWNAGTIYDMTVNVDFTGVDTNERYVEVTLPQGMRFTSYPVKTVAGGVQVVMDAITNSQTESVVELPSGVSYYSGTTSYHGTVKYRIQGTAGSYQLTFKITPDEYVNSPNEKNFENAVVVKATANGTSIGNVGLTLTTKGIARGSLYSDGVTGTVELGQEYYTGLAFRLAGGTNYLTELTYKVPYPKGTDIVATTGTIIEKNTDDPDNPYALIQLTNVQGRSGDVGHIYFNIYTQDLAEGTYTATNSITATATYYDGSTYEFSSSYKISITVQDASGVPNKFSVLAAQAKNYVNVTDNMQSPNLIFYLRGSGARALTNQWIEMEIDPTYHAEIVALPTGIFNSSKPVYYETNKGKSGTVMGQRQTTISTTKYGIVRSQEGLSGDEYFTKLKFYIGDVAKDWLTTAYADTVGWTDGNHGVVWGDLDVGASSATITIKTYASVDGENIEEASSNTATYTISHVAQNEGSLYSSTGYTGSTVNMNAGATTKNVRIEYSPRTVVWNSNSSGLYKNPEFIIKAPTGVSYSNFTAIQNIGGKTTTLTDIEINNGYVINGDTYVKVKCNTYWGGYKDYTYYDTVVIYFDVETSITAKGNYNWSDLVRFGLDSSQVRPYSNGNYVVDTNDINQNGKTDDFLSYGCSGTLNITAQTNLLIDSYIVPEGESRKAAYDENDENTSVGFTPDTRGTYTVEALNNRADAVNQLYIYLPVPKEDVFVGTEYQKEKYGWNMKVEGTPSIQTYNSSGVLDDSLQTKYEISYTSEKTYTTADFASDRAGTGSVSWSSTVSDTTTMIRVKLTGTMAVGEKVVLGFTYSADEVVGNIAVEKFGKVNAYNPYAYYSSAGGSNTWFSGTRVGVTLAMATIEGKLFLDKDIDGIKNNSDTWLNNKKIDLYKWSNSSQSYTFIKQVVTANGGVFIFDGLGVGSYKIDFNNAVTTTSGNQRYFTMEGKESQVTNTGSNTGLIVNVDPTKDESKTLLVGIMDYDPDAVLLEYEKSSYTLKEGNVQQAVQSVEMNYSIVPSYFTKLQIGTAVYHSNDTTIATIDTSRIITAVASTSTTTRTTNITTTLIDMFGNTITLISPNVDVKSNKIPTITLSTTSANIRLGDTFDAKTYILAASDPDSSIGKDDVVITNSPSTNGVVLNEVKSYTTYYKLTDSDGNSVEKSITFTVIAEAPILNVGDKVKVVAPDTTIGVLDGVTGRLFNKDEDVNLNTSQDDLSLSYIFKKDGNTIVSIPFNGYGSYEVTYTLKDTRTGLTTMQKRIYIISNNFAENDGLYLTSYKEITINESSLNRLGVNYLETIASMAKIEGVYDTEILTEGFEVAPNGFTYDSYVGEYTITYTLTYSGKSVSLTTKVIVTENAMGYVSIPTRIEIKKGEGIDSNHAGKLVEVGISDDIQTSKQMEVRTDSEIRLSNSRNGDSYEVKLYDGNKMAYEEKDDGKVVIGTVDSATISKQIWLNIERKVVEPRGRYEGSMTFYITVK